MTNLEAEVLPSLSTCGDRHLDSMLEMVLKTVGIELILSFAYRTKTLVNELYFRCYHKSKRESIFNFDNHEFS